MNHEYRKQAVSVTLHARYRKTFVYTCHLSRPALPHLIIFPGAVRMAIASPQPFITNMQAIVRNLAAYYYCTGIVSFVASLPNAAYL